MKAVLIPAIAFCLAAQCAWAVPELPKDVRSFIAKRDGCEHFRGEIPDPSEKQRMKEVVQQLNALCKGTDQALAKLRKKYAGNADVISRLHEYEDEIEPHPERRQAN